MDTILTLYSRENCHLCEDMIIQLQTMTQKYSFSLNIIDIDRTDEHLQKYNTSIPFLCFEDENKSIEICKYFFDEDALASFFVET